MENKLTYTADGPVARIRLNYPEKLNALDAAMIETLETALEQIDADEGCRVLILEAAGDRAFCAGADIRAWRKLGAAEMWRHWTRIGHRAFARLEGLRVPSIAAVDGIAYGGGLELALACDLIVCTAKSKFAFPEVTLGTIPGWGGTVRLPARIGAGRAKYMMLTGAPISAERAEQWGLVAEVVSGRDELKERIDAIAGRIAENAPMSVQAVKQLLQIPGAPAGATGAEAIAGGFTAFAEDAAEGLAAFEEKRPPRFSGR